MTKAVTYVIVSAGIGYAVAITLAILGCVAENKFWLLFLIAPFVFTPAMMMFIRPQVMCFYYFKSFLNIFNNF